LKHIQTKIKKCKESLACGIVFLLSIGV